LWAPAYSEETAVSALEDRLVRSVMPDAAGRRLLDVGAGTLRRMRALPGAAALAVGVDLVPEMLRAGGSSAGGSHRVAGDVLRLPFRDAAFDLVWCRLVLGHVEDAARAYAELARISRAGADLVVSDFHAAAVAAGHARTFRDPGGSVREIEHHARTGDEHAAVARAQGWTVTGTLEAPAGEPERHFYERAGRLAQLAAEATLPLVMVMCLRR
jgi:malonyl-CoA O-methyltransferase